MVWARLRATRLPGWEWYVIELNRTDEDGFCFGYVNGDFDELGSFTLAQIQSVGPVIIDRRWEPKPLHEVQAHVRQLRGGH